METFNPRKRKQYQNRNRTLLGIIICYTNKYGDQIEPMSIDAITRYKGKHNLPKDYSNKELAKHCLKYWNDTLQKGELPRKFIAVHEEYRITEFNKL